MINEKKRKRKEKMNLHTNNRLYFLKDFIYNINHCLVVLPAGWLAASQPQNVEWKSVHLMLKSQ